MARRSLQDLEDYPGSGRDWTSRLQEASLFPDLGTDMPTRDLYPTGRLFAVATVALERAHDIAVEGQSPTLSPAAQRRIQRRLATAMKRSVVAVEAIEAALTFDKHRV